MQQRPNQLPPARTRLFPPAPALCALVLLGAAVVHALPSPHAHATQPARSSGKPVKPAAPVQRERPEIGRDVTKLPPQVRDMREAILAAVASGRIEELRIPIQWNELPPDFGPISSREAIKRFKLLSADGEGREILAILGNILSAPYAVVREGADIENNKLYIWPYLARVPFATLEPAEKVLLLSIAPSAIYTAMKKSGRYGYWTLAIGADGTWHSFKRIE